jgi:hypothetical protein
VLLADVSERSIGSIFIGRWKKNGWGWGSGVYLHREGVVTVSWPSLRIYPKIIRNYGTAPERLASPVLGRRSLNYIGSEGEEKDGRGM